MALAFKRACADVDANIPKCAEHIKTHLGKAIKLSVDYDSIKTGFTGNVGSTSVARNITVLKMLERAVFLDNASQGLAGGIRYGPAKDALGKEAFNETFDEIRVRRAVPTVADRLTIGDLQVAVVPGDVESDAVKADGKVMVYTITTKADNEFQAGNSDICNYNILPKKIVDIL